MENINLIKNQHLSKLTTLRIGGSAEWLAEPKDINELKFLLSWAKRKNICCHIIGAGSNLLINDTNIKGLSLCLRKLHGYDINPITGEIKVFSGESLPNIARKAANAGLHGFEWSIGIPGTIGGAVVMNAGAQGSCIAERIQTIEVIPKKGGNPFEIKQKDLAFAYRNSRLQHEELIVLSASFKLDPGHSKDKINLATKLNLNKRTTTQPYHQPSCGSVFRNPEPMKAGQLIDNIGLKGVRVGGAEVSTIHANFIVNRSHATANDYQKLISLIQKKVHETYGVLLHPEVKRLGFEEKV
tara:strand:+ start:138 stop:1031 length:894 start_codon:yes stop_codon:yes gene_type:complete